MTPPPATVTAEKAVTERWTDRVHSIGTLFAIEGVDVAPQLAGQVTDYFFDSGDDVQKGAKLVQLDTLVEEADLANNKATLQQANLDYDRQSKLVKQGAVSQATLDATIAKRDSSQAAVAKMEAIIAEKTITAPFAGRLGLRHVERGQYVTAGQALVWLQALDPIWVDFPVPEADIGQFKEGSPIEITVDAFRGEVFNGEVEAFDARLSSRLAHADGARADSQSRPQAASRHVRQRRRACWRAEGCGDGAAHGAHLYAIRRQRVGGERGAAAARSAGSHGLERWRRFGGCRGRYRFSAG